ncbi:MAG TPA: hypothetical protein VF472_16450 [Burkholderiaceae bacterium]
MGMMTEYLRPWKLLSLACGIALLIAGSFYYRASDWDVGISLVMALFTYLTAPYSLKTIVRSVAAMRFGMPFAWALFWWVWSVDGCYWVYNTLGACAAEASRLQWMEKSPTLPPFFRL